MMGKNKMFLLIFILLGRLFRPQKKGVHQLNFNNLHWPLSIFSEKALQNIPSGGYLNRC